MVRTIACPTCGKPVRWTEESPWRPFCSERCRLIDLGDWIEERRRIAGREDDDAAPADPEAERH